MILDKIIEKKKEKVDKAKVKTGFEEMKKKAEKMNGNNEQKNKSEKNKSEKIKFLLKEHEEFIIISEVKKASPSKGKFDFQYDIPELVSHYEKGGADIISVVTEEDFFLGGVELFEEVRQSTKLPLLRKDFVIDSYQIYESKVIGADFILLISSVLSEKKLKEFIDISLSLGIEPLVEVHTKEDLQKALNANARMIGINNRNLKEFKTSLDNTRNILPLIPKDKIVISESGIEDREDILELREMGTGEVFVNGVLVGEALVKSKNPAEKISELKLTDKEITSGGSKEGRKDG